MPEACCSFSHKYTKCPSSSEYENVRGENNRCWYERKSGCCRATTAGDEGAVVGQSATKQLLSSAGLPCVIYCSTG